MLNQSELKEETDLNLKSDTLFTETGVNKKS